MKRHGTVAIVFAIAACCCGTRARTPEAVSQLPIFAGYGDLTWNRIVPDLGANRSVRRKHRRHEVPLRR